MTFYKKKSFISFCLTFIFIFTSMVLLSGCGSTNEKSQEAIKLLGEQEYQNAISLLDTAELEGEDEKVIARSKGIAYMGMADYEQAIEYFKKALASGNGLVKSVDYDINYYMAAAYTKTKNFAEAENIYNAIINMKKKDANASFLRGTVRLAQRNLEGAKSDFNDVVLAVGKDYDKIISIYEVMDYYGYRNEGKEYLNNVIEKYESQMNDFSKGKVYYYLGNYNDAAKLLEQARNNGEIESALYLGMAYEAIGEYNYAINVYSAYIEEDKANNPDIYNRLGICNILKRDYTAALKAFQTGKTLAEGRDVQSLAFNEIVTYEYLGEYEQAKLLMESYIRTYPDDTVAIREHNFLSTR